MENSRVFLELDICEGVDDTFARGFYFAREYPRHSLMSIAQPEDAEYTLVLLYTGETPKSGEIIELLKADNDYAEYLEVYREQVDSELDDEMDEILDN